MQNIEKYIITDLDGTITPLGLNNQKRSPPWWLWSLLIPFVLMLRPKKSVIKKMQLLEARGYKFIIVTSRPVQFTNFTKRLLAFYHVPFENVFCVGYGKGTNERKLKVIREQKAEIVFVDSNKRIVEFMKRNSVNAVTSLDYFFK